jgi:threonine dehydrogenase-like Zn-dependent dehydrogenase
MNKTKDLELEPRAGIQMAEDASHLLGPRGDLKPGMMMAFVMKRIGEVGLMVKPIPEPGPNDAVIKTTAALICTSDAHTVGGAIGERQNITLGHEAVGVIYKLGSDVRGFHVGQRVAVNAITPCFHCENCLRGFPSQCTQMLGGWKFANTKDGNLAEYFHVNDAMANLAPIPDVLRDDQAVYCCDMMSTGFMAAEHANIPIGGSVAIFAQGPVGLMATAGARLLGAGLIIAVESVPKRKELARRFGADVVIDFNEQDPIQAILDWTGGQGVDAAIEALGAPSSFEACIKVTRPGGTISNVGYHGQGDYVPLPRLEWGVGMGDKVIRTGLCPGGAERMKRLMRLLVSGRVDPTPLTTHRFPFDQVEKAFRMMQTKEDGILKSLILF